MVEIHNNVAICQLNWRLDEWEGFVILVTQLVLGKIMEKILSVNWCFIFLPDDWMAADIKRAFISSKLWKGFALISLKVNPLDWNRGWKYFWGKCQKNPWANNNGWLSCSPTSSRGWQSWSNWNSFGVEQQRLSIKDEFAQSTLEPLESVIIPHFNQIHFVLLLVVLVTMLWNAASIKEQRRLQKSIVWNYENTSALILMKRWWNLCW